MADLTRLALPIRPGLVVEMWVSLPMTAQDWAQLMKVMRKMKPGIVREPADG